MDVKLKIPAVVQLLKMTASGIGAVGGPMLARWKARAEADALCIEARAKADALRLITDAQAEAQESLNRSPSSIQGEIDIRGEIEARLSFQEEKRQANTESVVRKTASELGDKQVEAHDVDHDFMAHFFADVQDVSSEKMQQIWAKILAGEVEKPGRTSLQTLATLKIMSQKTAEMFELVAPFVIRSFIWRDEITKNIPGFPHLGNFMHLADYNLVRFDSQLEHGFSGRREYLLYDHDRVYRLIKSGEPFDFSLPAYALTLSGQELYRLLPWSQNKEYLGVLSAFLEPMGIKLSYARLLRIQDDGGLLLERPLEEIKPRRP